MTDAAIQVTDAAQALPPPPPGPASPQEYQAGRDALAKAGLLTEHVRFAYYGLEEPTKGDVLGHPAGIAPERRLRAFLIDVASGESSDVVVSVTTGDVVSRRVLDTAADGMVPILDSDF